MLSALARECVRRLDVFLLAAESLRHDASWSSAVAIARGHAMASFVRLASALHRTPRPVGSMAEHLFRHMRRHVPAFDGGVLSLEEVVSFAIDLKLAAAEWEDEAKRQCAAEVSP